MAETKVLVVEDDGIIGRLFQKSLERAKVTDPFGYPLKPFDEKILRIT
jgi:hypothetical protein